MTPLGLTHKQAYGQPSEIKESDGKVYPEIRVDGKLAVLMGAPDLKEGDCIEVPIRVKVQRHTKTTEAGKTSYSMTWCVTGIGEWEECESEDSDEDAAEYSDDVANLRATLDLDE